MARRFEIIDRVFQELPDAYEDSPGTFQML